MRGSLQQEQKGKERPLMQNHFWKVGDNFVLDRSVLFLSTVIAMLFEPLSDVTEKTNYLCL